MKDCNFITFKDRPLVRQGNFIFYGDMNERCYTMLTIQDSKPFKDISLSGKITVQLLLTDKSVAPKDALLKATEKDGLYKAMDIATAWLDVENAKSL